MQANSIVLPIPKLSFGFSFGSDKVCVDSTAIVHTMTAPSLTQGGARGIPCSFFRIRGDYRR